MSETATPATSVPSAPASVDVGEFTVVSNSESSEDMAKVLDSDSEVSKAAQKLGEKGGRAAAEARKIKPIPDKPKVEAKAEVKADDAKAKEAAPVVDEDKPGNPKYDAKARMLEATRQLAEERREKERLRAELEEARRAREQPPEQKAKTFREDPSVEPKEDDYESYGEFVRDMASYGSLQTYQRARQAEQQSMQRQEQERQYWSHVNGKIDSWNEKITSTWPDEASWKADGIDTRLIEWKTSLELGPGEAKTAQNAIADELVGQLEDPISVMRYLSKNPAELERLLGLPSSAAIHWHMAKIEERAASGSTKPEKVERTVEVSKAPPPLKVAKSAPKASDGEEELNELASHGDDPRKFDEYVRRRTASR